MDLNQQQLVQQAQQQDIMSYIPLLLPTLQKLKINISQQEIWVNQLTELRKKSQTVEDFPKMENDTFLRVFRREKISQLPIWIMRQAGRYLPEFRQVRKFASFFEVCDNSLLSTEVTLQPIKRYPLDSAIIFSDILVIPRALGMQVIMEEKKGPVFPNPLSEPKDIEQLFKALPLDQEKSFNSLFNAIFLTRTALQGKASLIGFCGAPWTLFTYMIEGGSSKTFAKSKKWIYKYKEDSLKLLQLLSEVLAEFLIHQIEAGVQAVQIFDSWAGELGPEDYQEYSLNFNIKIAQRVKERFPNTPIILFPKGAVADMEKHFKENCFDCISLDYTCNLESALMLAKKYGKVVQGNLDPGVLLADHDIIKQKVRNMIDKIGLQDYIVNLGHGLWPEHNPDNVGQFIKEVHEYSSQKLN